MSFLASIVGIVLVAAHLTAVNISSSAPLICIWLHRRWRHGDKLAGVFGRRLAWCSVWSLAVGVFVGLVLLGWLWIVNSPGYWQAVGRFPPRTFGFAAGELAFTGACLVAYVALWDRWRHRPWLHALIGVAAATNLLYHFPPLMIAIGNLATWPEWVAEPVVPRSVFRGLFLRQAFMGQVLHFALASLSVGGVLLMLIAGRGPAEADGRVGSAHYARAGAGIALVSSLLQFVVGPWMLLGFPGTMRNALIGDDWLASLLFFLSVVATLGMVRSLGQVVLGDVGRRVVHQSVTLLSVVILLMVAALARTRHIETVGKRFAVLPGKATTVQGAVVQPPLLYVRPHTRINSSP